MEFWSFCDWRVTTNTFKGSQWCSAVIWTISLSSVNKWSIEGSKQNKPLVKNYLGFIKASRLFLSSAVPAGRLSVCACSSRNWTAEYFPFLSPPSCFLSPVSLSLCHRVSTELWFLIGLLGLKWEGLRASWLCVQTSSLWSCRLKFWFHPKENI